MLNNTRWDKIVNDATVNLIFSKIELSAGNYVGERI